MPAAGGLRRAGLNREGARGGPWLPGAGLAAAVGAAPALRPSRPGRSASPPGKDPARPAAPPRAGGTSPGAGAGRAAPRPRCAGPGWAPRRQRGPGAGPRGGAGGGAQAAASGAAGGQPRSPPAPCGSGDPAAGPCGDRRCGRQARPGLGAVGSELAGDPRRCGALSAGHRLAAVTWPRSAPGAVRGLALVEPALPCSLSHAAAGRGRRERRCLLLRDRLCSASCPSRRAPGSLQPSALLCRSPQAPFPGRGEGSGGTLW